MPPFEKGHTTNLGKTPAAVKVKRRLKAIEKKEELEAQTAVPVRGPQRGVGWSGIKNFGFKKGDTRAGIKKRKHSPKAMLLWELEHDNGASLTRDIVRRLINMARAGDLKAIEMIMDRVDGKVPTTVAGDKDNPLIIQVEPILSARYAKPVASMAARIPKKVGRPRKDANTLPNHNLPGPASLPGYKLRPEVR